MFVAKNTWLKVVFFPPFFINCCVFIQDEGAASVPSQEGVASYSYSQKVKALCFLDSVIHLRTA